MEQTGVNIKPNRGPMHSRLQMGKAGFEAKPYFVDSPFQLYISLSHSISLHFT